MTARATATAPGRWPPRRWSTGSPTDPTGSGDGDALIIGDLNSYDKEDPIDAIRAGSDDLTGTGDDYTDLVAQFLGEHAYSFVFDGQVGYLDHALASADADAVRSPGSPSGTSTPTSPTCSTTT